MEIEANLQKILSNNHKPNIVINGLGLLGLSALEFLIDRNIDDEQIIVISNYTKDLKELINGKNIKLYQNLKLIDKGIASNIELIINCTHNATNIIDFEAITHI